MAATHWHDCPDVWLSKLWVKLPRAFTSTRAQQAGWLHAAVTFVLIAAVLHVCHPNCQQAQGWDYRLQVRPCKPADRQSRGQVCMASAELSPLAGLRGKGPASPEPAGHPPGGFRRRTSGAGTRSSGKACRCPQCVSHASIMYMMFIAHQQHRLQACSWSCAAGAYLWHAAWHKACCK